jgi:large subunit ribosomal protein L30e
MIEVDKAIRLAVKTGKVTLGSNNSIDDIKKGKPKMIIVASNCPNEIKNEIYYYSNLGIIPVYEFSGNSWELGSLCGKPFMVASLAIHKPGDSEILKLVEEDMKNVKAEV